MDEAGGWEVRSPKANKTITQMGDDPMNMSLDDIQATERKYTERSGGRRFNRGGGGGGGGRMPRERRFQGNGGGGGFGERRERRPDPDEPWLHDRFEGGDLRNKIGFRHNNSNDTNSSNNNNKPYGQRPSRTTAIMARLGGGPGRDEPGLARRSLRDALPNRSVAPAVEAAPGPALAPPLAEGAMVRVHNLDPDATAADIQATFSEFGAIIKCAVEYDAATKSGTADIVFKDKSSVRGAIATYNGVVADGRTLKVEEIVARGIQITGRSTAAAPTHSVQVSVLKTSVGSVVVGGMYSDRIAASEPAAGRMDSQGARKVPITERLGTRSAR